MGVAGTFSSGADEAWIVDLLKYKKRKNLIHEYYQKRQSFANFGIFFAGLIGASIVKLFGIKMIWPISGVSFLFTGIILMFAEEHFVKRKIKSEGNIKKFFAHTKKSVSYSIKHKPLLFLLLSVIFLLFFIVFSSDLIYYPFLQNLGFKDYWFGYLASALSLLGIFLPHFSKKLSDKFGGPKRLLISFFALEALLLFSIFFVNTIFVALGIYLLFMSVANIYNPAQIVFFQKFVPSKMRATIGSLKNMLYAFAALIAAPLAGFLADKIGIQNTIALGGVFLIPVIILYIKIREK